MARPAGYFITALLAVALLGLIILQTPPKEVAADAGIAGPNSIADGAIAGVLTPKVPPPRIDLSAKAPDGANNSLPLKVLVTDESGHPISAASVGLHLGSLNLAHGYTDAHGQAILARRNPTEAKLLAVSATDFASKIHTLTSEELAQQVVTVTLAKGGRIDGRVSLPDGSPPPETVTVIGSVVSSSSGGGAVSTERALLQAMRSTKTGLDGSFSLEGLHANDVYRLSAAGDSFVSWVEGNAQFYVCGEMNAEVTVLPMWGISVRFETRSGEPIPSDLLGYARPHFRHPSGIDLTTRRTSEAAFIEDAVRGNGDSNTTRTFVFAQTSALEETPPTVDLSYDIPGFGSADIALRLGGRGGSGLPESTLVFDGLHERWGSVRLMGTEPSQQIDDWGVVGQLELRNKASAESLTYFMSTPLSALRQSLIQVPVGDYAASFTYRCSGLTVDLGTESGVVVNEDDVCDLALHVPEGTGFLELGVARPNRGAVSGACFLLTLTIPGAPNHIKWRRPVFIESDSNFIGPLSEAVYRVEPVWPFRSSEGARLTEITSGAVTSEWFVLDE
jgi:hypothetical protein